MATFPDLNFDNLALRTLPIDPEERNYTRSVEGACFSKVPLSPVKNPQLVAASLDALALIDLDENAVAHPDFVQYFAGNKIIPGSQPAAHCYCGHQFGYFSGQLGDGAAMYLGEILNKAGERWEIQLKGAGPTPYSRQSDGRKVLRSTIREFLCSEAMFYLGIPTTRAGSCITSDTKVMRDMFYDGHNKLEKCTIVLRIAQTFIRFGSFEIFKTVDQFTGRRGPSVGKIDILKKLVDYVITTFYPEIHEKHQNNDTERIKEFYKEVVLRTARLVAHWQCVGFCHGVLNTDNMSIAGVTIDYGPFGFMENFNPDHICNSSDDGGRYTYVKQPEICQWNCQKLAEALQPLVPLSETLPILDDNYQTEYDEYYLTLMRKKLGLTREKLPKDKELVKALLMTMEKSGSDFTSTFRLLSTFPMGKDKGQEKDRVLNNLLEICSTVQDLMKENEGAFDGREFQMFLMLMRSNPELLEQLGKGMIAVERIKARIERAEELKKMTPEIKKSRDREVWMEWLNEYEARLNLEIQGIDDENQLKVIEEERVKIMNSNNPCFILRNYIAQQAIDKAEEGDYSEVVSVLNKLKHPYDMPEIDAGTSTASCAAKEDAETFVAKLGCKKPAWATNLRVS